VIVILAKIAFKILPGESMGLIMEIPPYRIPSPSSVLKHTWWKIISILSIVFPYYMVGGLLFAIAYLAGIFTPINNLLAPLVSGWLGLPAFATTLLIFGIVRKEFIVVLPVVIAGTTDLSLIFTPIQMITITIMAMFYMPCLATVEALRREYGWKKAVAIAFFETVFAIVLAGLTFRALPFLGL
jgi:ferrous iron transport protein B